MGNTLLLQCEAGISGDMMAAALLDAGGSEERLRKALKSMPLTGYELKITRKKKSSLDCCDFDVILTEGPENHDHDMEYLHGAGGQAPGHHYHEEDHHHENHDHHHPHHDHGHHHEEDHHHDEHHSHHHGHSHDHHPHSHRGLKEIRDIIEKTELTPGAEKLALRIFEILAQSEARAHGTTVEEVHFHEVGAVDSIVDIVSVAVLLDDLDIENAIISHLCEGQGTIRCRHGILPIPVPATSNIVQRYNIPMEILPIKGELVTPTGAAIVAAIRTQGKCEGPFTIKTIGLGAGKREYETSGILRAMLIE